MPDKWSSINSIVSISHHSLLMVYLLFKSQTPKHFAVNASDMRWKINIIMFEFLHRNHWRIQKLKVWLVLTMWVYYKHIHYSKNSVNLVFNTIRLALNIISKKVNYLSMHRVLYFSSIAVNTYCVSFMGDWLEQHIRYLSPQSDLSRQRALVNINNNSYKNAFEAKHLTVSFGTHGIL